MSTIVGEANVSRSEKSRPLEQRNSECTEIAGADDIEIDRVFFRSRRRPSLDRDSHGVLVVGERDIGNHRGGLHARNLLDTVRHL